MKINAQYTEEQYELAEDLAYGLNKILKPRGLNIEIDADAIIDAMGEIMYLTWIPEEYR